MTQTMSEHVMGLSEKLQAINDFEEVTDIFTSFHNMEHHEEGSGYQDKFAKDVLSVREILRPKNPFSLQNGCDLVSLYTQEVIPAAVAETLCNAYELGEKRHEEFVCERLEKCEVSNTDPIKSVALQTFAKFTDTKSKDNNKVNALKKDVLLVSHLFLSLQSRPDFDLDELFKYASQREPPSLSDKGKLRSGKESDIVQCLTIPNVTTPDMPNDITVIVLDAPAVVRIIRRTKAADFQLCVDYHFIPYIASIIT